MSREYRLVLAACCLAMLSVGENSTAIMAALPAMTSSLGFSPATVEWVVNAYLKRRLEQWGEGYHAAAPPPMPRIASKLPPEQIEALASYLSFVR